MYRDDKNFKKRLSTYEAEVEALMELSDVVVNNSRANGGIAVRVME